MTVIVAYKTEYQVIMACDGRTLHGDLKMVDIEPKIQTHHVFQEEDRTQSERLLIGYSGYVYHQNLFVELEPPKKKKGMSNYAYVTNLLVPQMKGVILEQKGNFSDSGIETYMEALIAIGTDLFLLCSDLALVGIGKPFHACGSGQNFALGILQCCLKDVESGEMESAMAVLKAIAHTCELTHKCGYPVMITGTDSDVRTSLFYSESELLRHF